MVTHFRRDAITDAIDGRRAGLTKAQLDQLVERTAAEAGDIQHAVNRAQHATDAAWPPDTTDTQEGEEA